MSKNLNKQPRIAQFNKLTREFITFIGVIDSKYLNCKNYIYTDVIEVDEENEVLTGNADNWEIKSISEMPFEIKESDLNTLARERIIKTYPIENQLTIIGQTLEKVAEKVGVDCEELKALNDFVEEIRRVNKLRKKFYEESSDYNYISTEDFETQIERKYRGAIDEFEREVFGL